MNKRIDPPPRRRTSETLAIGILAGLLAAGCAQSNKRLSDINQRLARMDSQIGTVRGEQQSRFEQQRGVIGEIQNQLEPIAESGGTGARPYSQGTIVSTPTSSGDIQSIAIDELNDPPPPPPSAPGRYSHPSGGVSYGEPGESPDRILQRAFALHNMADFKGAAQEFLRAHDASGNPEMKAICLYWTGDSYFREKEWDKSLQYFIVLEKQHPGSNLLPSAYLKSGFVFINLGEPDKGAQIMRHVIDTFPDSDEAKTAREQLTRMDIP